MYNFEHDMTLNLLQGLNNVKGVKTDQMIMHYSRPKCTKGQLSDFPQVDKRDSLTS